MSNSVRLTPALLAAMAARFFITFAVQVQSVLLGWQMYELNHDPYKLGLIGLIEAAPALTMALYAGHIVDRSPPVRIYRFLIFFALISFLTAMNAHAEGVLYLAAFITGLARSFAAPSMSTIIPKIVERIHLPKAMAWTTMVNRMALVLGPVAAGVFYAWKGYTLTYGIAMASAICSFFATFLLPKLNPPERVAQENLWQSLSVAVKYVFSHQLMLSVLSLDMFAVLFGGVTAILPAIAKDVLHTDSVGLGVLRAAPAVGAILVTLFLTRFSINKNAGRSMLLCVFAFGLCIIGFAASRNFILSCALLFVSGMVDSVSMVVRGSILQLISPDSMRGRIASVNSMFIVSSNELGAFESGTAAGLMGLIPSIYFGGAMTLVTVAVIYLIYPKLGSLNLDDL